jgi:hypothetical protein
MSPLMQQIAEELVQPTDQLNRPALLLHGQSVKLIGMCAPDEELVEAWLRAYEPFFLTHYIRLSVMLARKLHALATPDQRAKIGSVILQEISKDTSCDGCFELAWLCGLLSPSYPKAQACCRKNNVNLFPALTFAMIVAMCDGYLELARPRITLPQTRFFDFVARLPMDLQALIALRLWEQTSTVIPRDKFDRVFLAVI